MVNAENAEYYRIYAKAYRKKNPLACSKWRKITYEKRKLKVLSHYSQGALTCAFCGISDIRVLSIDHVGDTLTNKIIADLNELEIAVSSGS